MVFDCIYKKGDEESGMLANIKILWHVGNLNFFVWHSNKILNITQYRILITKIYKPIINDVRLDG